MLQKAPKSLSSWKKYNMAQGNQLYRSVLEITTDYLGPAAHRFVDRQIENHLNKSPNTINKADLDKLIDWIQVALAMLTDDKILRRQYVKRLKSLTYAKSNSAAEKQ